MNDYIRLRIDADPVSEDMTDLLAAFLADEGYESFEPDGNGLTAFIPANDFCRETVDRILDSFPMSASFSVETQLVEGKDWNEEWEKNYFRPIVVANGKVAVHSSFHKDVPDADYDIVIDPRMAFGTGHHSTTSMMLGHLIRLMPEGKKIIDMGTGTAILAILAAKMGADYVAGIEIDPMACDNARDNARLNGVSPTLICGDSSALDNLPKADIFLANINRNIILADLSRYVSSIAGRGYLVTSGFYAADIPLIERAASTYGLVKESESIDNEWASVVFRKAD